MLQSLARPTRLTRVPCIPDIPPFFRSGPDLIVAALLLRGFLFVRASRGFWVWVLSVVRARVQECLPLPPRPPGKPRVPCTPARFPEAPGPLSCDQVSSALLSSGFDSRASGTKPFCFRISAVRVRVGVLVGAHRGPWATLPLA